MELNLPNPFRILVVEDKPKQLQIAQDAIELMAQDLPVQVQVHTATTLYEALALVESVDAVMSDAFFPCVAGQEEQLCGKLVVEYALMHEKPVVLVSDEFHHGDRLHVLGNWSNHWSGVYVFGMVYTPFENAKPWDGAFLGLIYQMVGIQLGQVIIEEGRLLESSSTEGHPPSPIARGLHNELEIFFLGHMLKTPGHKELWSKGILEGWGKQPPEEFTRDYPKQAWWFSPQNEITRAMLRMGCGQHMPPREFGWFVG